MNAKTFIFNSDGDCIRRRSTVYGLDKINTGSRPHLMSALSSKRARYLFDFMNNIKGRNLFDELTGERIDSRNLSGSVILNGPGSGYLLSDDTFTHSTLIPLWASTEFSSLWKDNINQIYLQMVPPGSPLVPLPYLPDRTETENLLNALSNDWLIGQLGGRRGLILGGKEDTDLYTHVNLVGWGRGGVSCHMLANLLRPHNISINILAIDPVTGTDFAPDQITLGSNVKEYVGLYARDERSASLPCIVPDTDPNTRVHIYPIAGRHTTLIGNQAADGDKSPGTFSEPSDLVFYLAMKCLNRWDPSLSISTADSGGYPDLSSSGNELLAKMKSDYDNYLTMRNTTYSNQFQELKNEREIVLNGQHTNFKSAQGPRFTPSQGLAKGHIEDMSYFQDII